MGLIKVQMPRCWRCRISRWLTGSWNHLKHDPVFTEPPNVLRVAIVTFALVLLAPTVAFALGLVVTNGCVARGVAPTTSGGVALQPADGILSFKLLISPIAATGGPVLPPPGSTVILAAGTAVPICVALPPGQYAYWWIATLTPPPPLPGQLAGTPMDSDPSVAVPFVVGTPAPATKKPDPVTNPTITP